MITEDSTLAELAASVDWFHSIDLGHGVVTDGMKPADLLKAELESLRLPPLEGKSVLDIGAWDGFYSFAAERLGARTVLATDFFMWAIDVRAHFAYWRRCKERGVAPGPYDQAPYWDPAELPGKRGFDIAHEALGSQIGTMVFDFPNADPAEVGVRDVVLFLGVLYHIEDPMRVLRKVAAATGEVAIIETEAVVVSRYEDTAIWEFFPTNELNGDVSNWWAPNRKALEGACLAAGFSRVETIVGPPEPPRVNRLRSSLGQIKRAVLGRPDPGQGIRRYRLVVHAYK